MHEVVERLQGLEPEQVKAALDQQPSPDASVNIVMATLDDVDPVVTGEGTYRFHAARILPAGSDTPNFVRPHLHHDGQEPYVMLNGTGGEMNTGWIEGERIKWDDARSVSPGEVIMIEENQVHSLRNTDEEQPFDFVFACPDRHLDDYSMTTNPNGDRYFTDHLDNPLPPHYNA